MSGETRGTEQKRERESVCVRERNEEQNEGGNNKVKRINRITESRAIFSNRIRNLINRRHSKLPAPFNRFRVEHRSPASTIRHPSSCEKENFNESRAALDNIEPVKRTLICYSSLSLSLSSFSPPPSLLLEAFREIHSNDVTVVSTLWK